MNQSVMLITLGVADLARSREFYSDGLGWTPTLDVPDEIVFYQVGHGLLLGLYPLTDLGADAGVPATAGSSFSLACNLGSAAEVDAAFQRAVAAGATVLKEPAKPAQFDGRHCYVTDPDGHRWEIAFNPGIVVDPDGGVRFAGAA
jgi:catechol 2,3-dioxygenase-like lactoylglutathione lyase family enzyme